MLSVLTLVLPLFFLIVAGYISGRLVKLPIEGLAWLNFFLLYISLPALFFRLLSKTPFEEFSNASFLLNTTAATFSIFLLCFVIALLFSREGIRVATIQGFAGAYGNIGYLGPPLAIAAFGPAAGVPVALIFCVDNTMHFTLAPLLMALGEKSDKNIFSLLAGIFKKIFTHPFILATIAGMTAAWLRFEPPAIIDTLLLSLSNAAAPCALFAMGVTAALRPLKRVPPELGYLVPIKLVLHPLLIYIFLKQIPDLDPVWLYSAVLLGALPAATNVFILAQNYSVWEERASSAVVVTTAASIVTLTIYLYLARTGLI